MDLPTSFGYWVRRRRKALDLTQAALAQRVGCAKVTIQKIEAEERRRGCKRMAEPNPATDARGSRMAHMRHP